VEAAVADSAAVVDLLKEILEQVMVENRFL
jgi:hypothetical protein